MKNLIFIILAATLTLMMSSCEKDVVRNETSIIPVEFEGRPNEVIGELQINSREVTISLWDHGQIDGDIVSIYVNGELAADEVTLKGPSEKYIFNTELKYNGYNYILMYAHNTGWVAPNTAALSIDDGSASREFEVESSLTRNGTWDIVVD